MKCRDTVTTRLTLSPTLSRTLKLTLNWLHLRQLLKRSGEQGTLDHDREHSVVCQLCRPVCGFSGGAGSFTLINVPWRERNAGQFTGNPVFLREPLNLQGKKLYLLEATAWFSTMLPWAMRAWGIVQYRVSRGLSRLALE